MQYYLFIVTTIYAHVYIEIVSQKFRRKSETFLPDFKSVLKDMESFSISDKSQRQQVRSLVT